MKAQKRDVKKDLQAALQKMPPKTAQVVRDGVKKNAPDLLRGEKGKDK